MRILMRFLRTWPCLMRGPPQTEAILTTKCSKTLTTSTTSTTWTQVPSRFGKWQILLCQGILAFSLASVCQFGSHLLLSVNDATNLKNMVWWNSQKWLTMHHSNCATCFPNQNGRLVMPHKAAPSWLVPADNSWTHQQLRASLWSGNDNWNPSWEGNGCPWFQ